jgi:3-phosphoshikimate 1-carboxyvinyltransferase
MIIRVSPSTLSGEVTAPPSKSLSARFIAAALLADSPTMLHGISDCDDTNVALSIAAALGAEIELGSDSARITPCPSSIPRPRSEKLHAGESGLAARMFAPIASLSLDKLTLTGEGSLMNRPFEMVINGLAALGVKTTGGNTLPLTIEGPLVGGKIDIDGSISSQFLTGLLLALPYADQDSTVVTHNLTSRPYIDMTLEVMRAFDLDFTHETLGSCDTFLIPAGQTSRSLPLSIDGDWSAASALLVLGGLCAQPDLEIKGLRGIFTQADSAIKGAMLFAGYHILGTDDGLSLKKKRPRPINLDLSNSPDLFPVLCALAAFSNKPSRLSGANRLASKESDRASVLISEFAKAGVRIEREDDTLVIHPCKQTQACRIDPHGDHRIVMAAAILGCAGAADIEILDADCVAKSYPMFFDDLVSIGGCMCEVQ